MKTMKRTWLLFASAAAGALALGAPLSKATPVATPSIERGVVQAHAVRICDDDGDCWWTTRHRHRGDWDDDHDRGWRHGYRDYDDDHYGRAPRHGRDWNDRDYDRDHERHGKMDKDRERGEWGRSSEREHHGMDDKDRDKDYRADQGMKERGEQGEKKK
ncbi:hypothetical protein [Methylocystis parvus]|uniref:hypothetical protein n=1 Tax=Methylocystis parvus TaxID=134 RepID=UPI003C737ABA